MSFIKEKLDYSEVTEEDVRRIAALKVAMKQYTLQSQSTAIAIQCWSSLQDAIGIMPCLVNAILTDEQPSRCDSCFIKKLAEDPHLSLWFLRIFSHILTHSQDFFPLDAGVLSHTEDLLE